MKVASIKRALAGLSKAELLASVEQAVVEHSQDAKPSRAFLGLAFPECWCDEAGYDVDYSCWFALREDLAAQHGIRQSLSRIEWPSSPEIWALHSDS